jgi:hypothetical protein
VADDVGDAYIKAIYLADITETFWNERNDLALGAARRALKTTLATSPDLRSYALSHGARVLARIGDGEGALKAALDASIGAETLDQFGEGWYGRTLGALACAVARCGQRKLALLAAEQGLRAIPHDDSSGPLSGWERREIAPAFAWAGDVARAIAVATSLADISDRAQALRSIMEALVESRNGGESHAVVVAAEQAAAAHPVGGENDWIARGWLAQTLAMAGEIDKSVSMAKQCGSSRMYVLSDVAGQIARSGRPSDALAVSRMIKHPRHRLSALQAVSEAYEKAGDGRESLAIVDDVFKGHLRPVIISRLAGIAATKGDNVRAELLAHRALDECRKFRTSPDVADEPEVILNLIALAQDEFIRAAALEVLAAAKSSGDPYRILTAAVSAAAFAEADQARRLATEIIRNMNIDLIPAYESDTVILLIYAGHLGQALDHFIPSRGSPHFLERPLTHLLRARKKQLAIDAWQMTLIRAIEQGTKEVLDTLFVGIPVVESGSPDQLSQIVTKVIEVGSSWWLSNR